MFTKHVPNSMASIVVTCLLYNVHSTHIFKYESTQQLLQQVIVRQKIDSYIILIM